ncbi:MAG: hypothetical protein HKN03_15445 [Acidimicrobiales bacterium]|nr:hypothetical protein [Acidimicrobiales bacterium]
MTAATPSPASPSSWTAEDERALLRRQRLNERAVQLSSLLSAGAVALGAVLTVFGLYRSSTEAAIPAAPVEPLAFELRDGAGVVVYETDVIQQVAADGLEMIRYPWRSELQGWEIAFLAPRGRASGYTWSDQQKIEIFVKESDDADRVARVLAHELGHAVDVTLNTGDERRAWLAERDADNQTAWWPTGGGADFETGAGDFAEVFASWQLGNDDFRSEVNPDVDAGDLQLLEQLAVRNSSDQ